MKEKSVKFNFIMNMVLTMSNFIFPLITFPYVSRILLPIGTGKVAFATSIVTYFSMFAQLGIPTYGIRVCAQVRDDKEKLSRTEADEPFWYLHCEWKEIRKETKFTVESYEINYTVHGNGYVSHRLYSRYGASILHRQ